MDWYILPVNPEPWAIGPLGTGRRAGKIWAFVGQNPQLHAYQQAVKESIENPTLVEGNIHLIFYFWRQLAKEAKAHVADVTNMQKATEDALQGVLYENDRYTRQVTSVLVEQDPDISGQVVIGIGPYDPKPFPEAVKQLFQTVKPLTVMSDNTYDDARDLF